MKSDPSPFDPSFQYALAALLIREQRVLMQLSRVMQPEYFTLEPVRAIVTELIGYWREYRKLPTSSVLWTIVTTRNQGRDAEMHTLMTYLYQAQIPDREWLLNRAASWCGRQSYLLAITNAFNAIQNSTSDDWAETKPVIDAQWEKTRAGSVAVSEEEQGIDILSYNFAGIYDYITANPARKLLATGWPTFNRIYGGIGKQELSYFLAGTGKGKAQPLDEPVLTPQGWVRMGDLQVGDSVVGQNGQPTKVVAVHPQGAIPVYRVTMRDGSSTECCDDHLWSTTTFSDRKHGRAATARTLREIRQTLHRYDGHPNHEIPVVEPVRFASPHALPLDPYLLGLLIGDGCFSGRQEITFCKPEPDIQKRFAALLPAGDRTSHQPSQSSYTVRVHQPSQTRRALEQMGLIGCTSTNKFIPEMYLRAAVNDRIRLLQGLMDTDGHVTASGCRIDYSTSSERLHRDVVELVQSLGGLARVQQTRRAYNRRGVTVRSANTTYRIGITFSGSSVVPVSSSKHLKKWKHDSKHRTLRTIKSVEPVGVKECQCITVAAPDHLYVTKDYIVTHNSWVLQALATAFAINGYRIAIYSLELTKNQMVNRLISVITGMPDALVAHNHRAAQSVWDSVRSRGGSIHIESYPPDTETPLTLRDRFWQLCDRTGHKPDAVIIDAGDNMHIPHERRDGNEWTAEQKAWTSLRQWAIMEDVAMVTAAQGDRRAQDRERVGIGDTSGAFGKNRPADLVISLNQTEEEVRASMFRMFGAKSRHGAGFKEIAFKVDLSCGKFQEMGEAGGGSVNLQTGMPMNGQRPMGLPPTGLSVPPPAPTQMKV